MPHSFKRRSTCCVEGGRAVSAPPCPRWRFRSGMLALVCIAPCYGALKKQLDYRMALTTLQLLLRTGCSIGWSIVQGKPGELSDKRKAGHDGIDEISGSFVGIQACRGLGWPFAHGALEGTDREML